MIELLNWATENPVKFYWLTLLYFIAFVATLDAWKTRK